MGDDKALGPDGFTTKFFKCTWNVIGSDVYFAVRVFFLYGKLLRTLNNTILARIPKTNSPSKFTDSPYYILQRCLQMYR